MIVIIDGYNLLKSVFHRVKGKLDKQRTQLIKELGFYKQLRPDITNIILVFDAGPFGHATREVHSGIVVVFAGQRSTADRWIVDYVKRNKEKEMLLVSRDRELVRKCERYGADAFDVDDFYQIVQNAILDDVTHDMQTDSPDGTTHKFEDESSEIKNVSSQALDLLMEQSTVEGYHKEDAYKQEARRKKRKAHTPSKEDKRLSKKIKKL